jgi:hypothetical protein
LFYLRSFKSDPSTTKIVFAGLFATEEEQLRDVLQPIGELVAIGRPGEELPTPGAARLYVSDEEWKGRVEREMLAVRLVIIRAAIGENLLWEVKHALETLNPQKVLILVLNMSVKDYECFRTNVNPLLRASLPEGATLWRRLWRVSGFIAFAPDWKPSFFPLRAPLSRRHIYKYYWSPFKFALRPVFESFGVEWQPPPVPIEITMSAMAVILWMLGSVLWLFFRPIVH